MTLFSFEKLFGEIARVQFPTFRLGRAPATQRCQRPGGDHNPGRPPVGQTVDAEPQANEISRIPSLK
jgi:hypothetical protein